MLPSNPRNLSASRNKQLPPLQRARSASRPRYVDSAQADFRADEESMAAYPAVTPTRSQSQTVRGSSRRMGSSSSDLSSVSSNGSSFLERMKSRSNYSTPRTSIEEDDPPKTPRSSKQPPTQDETAEKLPGNDTWGATIWNRLATAAGSLSVNVDLSWASNIAVYSGEETPPGQDSRLTQALKAYHIGKAQDPSDLPAWLFDERERRAASGPRTRKLSSTAYHALEADVNEAPRTGSLKEIYAVTTDNTRGRDMNTSGTKAANRLKAIRDAKRQAAAPTYVKTTVVDDQVYPYSAHGHHYEQGSERRREAHGRFENVDATRHVPQGRVGLPSRPARHHGRAL